MIWRLGYRLLLWLLFPWVLMHLWWRGRRQPGYREHIPERFGWYQTRPGRPVIWLHAVSVGETRAAEPLVRALAARYPGHELLLTQMTPTGRETAQQLYGGAATIVYLPYDYPGAVARFLTRFRPRLGILMETEIWFNLVECCARQSVPLLLANARLSEKSARGYELVAPLTRAALGGLAAVMRLVGDVIPDVMQQSRRRQEGALMTGELFSCGQTVKDLLSQLRHLARMRFFVSEAPSDCVDSTQLLIVKVRRGWTRLGLPVPKPIDYHAFPQSPFAGTKRIDPECSHCSFKDLSTGNDNLRTLRADARRAPPCLGGLTCQLNVESQEKRERNRCISGPRRLVLSMRIACQSVL